MEIPLRYASCIAACALLLGLANCGGSGTSSQGPTITSVSISPTTVSLQVSQPQQFTANVSGTGDFDASVEWFVNDVAGGNGSVGTIVSGLYTAPAQLPSPATVSIKATASADPSKSAVAQAKIRGVLIPTVVWNETNLSQPGSDDGEATETPPGISVADDGAGGAFVVWEHRFPVEVLAQHLDASGEPTWTAGGIPVTSPWTGYQASPRAISDGVGGLIIVWLDGRAGFCDPSFQAECDIYGQRIDATGSLLWGPVGKPVATAANNQGLGGISIIGDDASGAIVAFQDNRINSTTQGGSGGYTVYAQRVNANGDPVWQTDGIRIGQDPEAGDAGSIFQVKLISDGAGGAIGAWYFTSYAGTSHITLRSQRISSTGQLLWGSSAVSVPGLTATDPNGTGTQSFDMKTDGAHGALLVASWQPANASSPAILAQRLDATGVVAWAQSGMAVSNSTNYGLNPATMADGAGGLFAAWQDCPNEGANCDIAMQHLNASGQTTWGQGQVYLVQLPNQQLAPTLQPDGTGGALVLWTDCRAYSDANSCYANSDVYAQDVDASGNGLWLFNGYPLLADAGNQGEQYYLYTPVPATVSVRLQSGDIFLAWPDGRDNICFNENAATACEVFVERISF
jgi:hypothetical protein